MSRSHPVFLLSAARLDLQTLFVRFSGERRDFTLNDIHIEPHLDVLELDASHDGFLIKTSPQRHDINYLISVFDSNIKMIDHGPWLDRLFSDEPLGCRIESDKTSFSLFAPRASKVLLILFDFPSDDGGREYSMTRNNQGVWTLTLPENHTGKAYGYRVFGPMDESEWFNPEVIIADPYSMALASKLTWKQESRSLIINPFFDWGQDKGLTVPPEDLIIYECHVRDMTAHQSAENPYPGTYKGFTDKFQNGGMMHIKKLGVNAIEFLPLHKFGVYEPPFHQPTESGVVNTWNPYERNHWGYMTSNYFAPESYYAQGGSQPYGEWIGVDGSQVNEVRQMVKDLHENGFAVFLDVVYNHVSQYDQNPLKYIDKKYYFRLDENGKNVSDSGCGNDFKSERPMARRLIIDSVIHWVKDYHFDGFRFDLANILDKETRIEIREKVHAINPNIHLIAEPWGGGYDPGGFSDIGWASWNDQIRNGIKGFHPLDEVKGFIFGQFHNGSSYQSLKRWIMGSQVRDGGPFTTWNHSVNYLESHDDHTLGDFIRLGIGRHRNKDVVNDLLEHTELSAIELKLHKLAATFLFVSRGPILVHAGQEFARSKVVAKNNVNIRATGLIDHNSYNKDDETNFIDFSQVSANEDLFDYYCRLTDIRKRYKTFRIANHEQTIFTPFNNSLLIIFEMDGSAFSEPHFLVAMNGNRLHGESLILPPGFWEILITNTPIRRPVITEKLFLAPSDAYILKKMDAASLVNNSPELFTH